MFKVETVMEFDDQKVKDLLTTALEGGSNYWARIVSYHPSQETFVSEYEFPHIDIPFDDGYIMIEVEDFDEGIVELGKSSRAYTLSRTTMEQGLSLLAILEPNRHWQNFINDNADAETGDVFLQLCLFGEVIYG